MNTSICLKCKGEGRVWRGLLNKEKVMCQKCWGTGIREETNEFQATLSRLTLLRPRIIRAKNQGMDLSQLMVMLDKARKALKNKDYDNANLYIDQAEELLDGIS